MLCTWNQISVLIGANRIFEGFSFEVLPQDKIGLVGRNGSGKTTIFKTIAGLAQPDRGEMSLRKGTTVGYLPQIPQYPEGTTVRDVLMQAFTQLTEARTKLTELETLMGAGPDSDQFERILMLLSNIFMTHLLTLESMRRISIKL